MHELAPLDNPQSRLRRLRSLPAPEPVGGIENFNRERERALARSPECRANYDHYLASRRRGASVDYLPIKLDIENVSRCNFRCTMCTVSEWHKGIRAKDMPLADFQRLIDEQIGLVELKLQGLGEPTMQGDDFFAMIHYARAKPIWVRTTTNASLLHLRDNYRKLIDSGVNEVQISIDGATKEVFESVRHGSVFERVAANCKLINGYARELGIERTKMWTVVQRANLHQLEDLVDLAAGLGFANQVFSLEMTDWGIDAWREKSGSASVETQVEPDDLFALIERGRRLGVKVRFWNITEKYDTGSPEGLCPWPFERAFVASDLRVVPCCFVANPDVAEIGDGIRDGRAMSDIWRGDDYKAFRQAHLDGRVPKFCAGCYRQGTAHSGS